jgi:hydrogenase maturation protease
MLVAGIGNIFRGDDAFGSEVARRLAARTLPQGVGVRDFGNRAIDLAYALVRETGEAILIDAVSRGGAPGTLYVIDGDDPADEARRPLAGHDIEPFTALTTARAMGATARVTVVGCEPESFGTETGGDGRMGLSPRVAAAVEPAVDLVISLAGALDTGDERQAQG